MYKTNTMIKAFMNMLMFKPAWLLNIPVIETRYRNKTITVCPDVPETGIQAFSEKTKINLLSKALEKASSLI